MIGDDVALGATTEPDWMKAWGYAAQTWTESGFIPMSLGLVRATQQVREFMEIGQPDMLPDDLRTPSVSDPDARETLRDISAQIHQASNALKRQIVAGYDPSPDLGGARYLLEELGETLDALLTGDTEGYADGLADLVYVAIGAALRCCIPLPAVWAEVHAANMRKYPSCLPCAGTGFTLFYPWSDEAAWSIVALQIVPESVDSSQGKLLHLAIRETARLVGLPGEALWRLCGRQVHPSEGPCYDTLPKMVQQALLAYRDNSHSFPRRPFQGVTLQTVEDVLRRVEAHFEGRPRDACPACGGCGVLPYRSPGGEIEKPPGWHPPNIRRALGE